MSHNPPGMSQRTRVKKARCANLDRARFRATEMLDPEVPQGANGSRKPLRAAQRATPPWGHDLGDQQRRRAVGRRASPKIDASLRRVRTHGFAAFWAMVAWVCG